MQFKLIEPKKSKGETEIKTEVKISIKELDNPVVKAYLLSEMRIDYTKPIKQNSKYVYFMYNGDWLNKDKEEKCL